MYCQQPSPVPLVLVNLLLLIKRCNPLLLNLSNPPTLRTNGNFFALW
jgi:hypothetical protein